MGYGYGFDRPSGRAAPVEIGKVYEAKIVDMGRDGDGIAKIENFVVFVPGTKVRDEVKVRITKLMRRSAQGEVEVEE